MKIRLPEHDDYADGTTIWLTSGHTFTKRAGAWQCFCEPNPWRWPNVKAYAERHGVVEVDAPGAEPGLIAVFSEVAAQ